VRTITATEASRSFAAVLDAAERGETIIVTRGGRRIVTIGPAAAGNGAEVLAVLGAPLPDEDFADDVLSARETVTDQEPAWPAD